MNLLRTAYPKKVEYKHIRKVRNQLEKENSTSEQKIKEIFQEIDVDIVLENYLES